jgi:hypothetical protein
MQRTTRSNNPSVKRKGTRRNGDRLPSNQLTQSTQFQEPTTVFFPKNCVGLPDRLGVILKYAQNYNNSGSATPSAQVFALNSGFDPDFSGTGHQPSFWDKIAAVYGRYYVRAFKMELAISQGQAATVPTEWVCCYSDQNIGANTVEELIEAKYSKNGILGLPSAGNAVVNVSLPWMSTAKLMGQPFTEADDNMYSGVGSSPTDVAWGIVKLQAQDGTTTVSARVRATLYMEIIFKDVLTQSTS